MRTLKPRRTLAAAAAALVGVSALVASGSAASADVTAQDTCDRGEVCVYDELGNLIASSGGDMAGPFGPLPGGGTVVNNGLPHAGYDHITYTVVTSSGDDYSVCLHYPGDDTPTSGGIPVRGIAKDIHWMDAC